MQEYIKKILDSGNNPTTLIISSDEMEDIMKIVKSPPDFGLLIKGVIETIQNEAKEQKGRFLKMLLGTLGASLLRNMLAGKGVNRAGYGHKDLQSKNFQFNDLSFKKGIIRAGCGSKLDF